MHVQMLPKRNTMLACALFLLLALAPAARADAAAKSGNLKNDILNFLINLECLEAQFYCWAAFGRGLLLASRPAADLSRSAAAGPV
jgi:hypothetical protein